MKKPKGSFLHLLAFNDIARLVSYIIHNNKATILISITHKSTAVDESGSLKKTRDRFVVEIVRDQSFCDN